MKRTTKYDPMVEVRELRIKTAKLVEALEGIELVGKHATAGHDEKCECGTCELVERAHNALTLI
jgi:hypothetical protein